VKRLVKERMPEPRDLPCLKERIAKVFADVTAEMEDEGPGHCDRKDEAAKHPGKQLERNPTIATGRGPWPDPVRPRRPHQRRPRQALG
jgi:hypothetical protein